ncbi:MAG: hypothetical protein CM1200mP40_24580 [Gammaproteobacteria bacterium]|nr:MAG: hypothetical protein CM1200mP40_24580 [Gammaproteobacteria bacterium]
MVLPSPIGHYFSLAWTVFHLRQQSSRLGKQWVLYLIMVAAQLGYPGLLLVGIRAAYKGPNFGNLCPEALRFS